jgi:transcriptional regulator with XRE-family HTH domain
MDEHESQQLGQFLQAHRTERGLSTHKLAAAAHMDQATIVRFEAGAISAPRPDKLARIAEVLGVSSADVFALAGYKAPSDLPSLRPYLSTKYPALLAEDLDRIEAYVARIVKRRSTDLTTAANAGASQDKQADERG